MINSIFNCDQLDDCTKILTDKQPSLKKQIESSFENPQDLKNKLFFNMFAQVTKETKGKFIITGVKDNKIVVYPELTTLKLIQFVPNFIVTKALNMNTKQTIESD
jgi:hypothetical protein